MKDVNIDAEIDFSVQKKNYKTLFEQISQQFEKYINFLLIAKRKLKLKIYLFE